MLSDRTYMRDDYPRNATSALTWLISAIVATFLLQFVFLRWFNAEDFFDSLLALTVANIKAGKVWTLLTYSFLHSTGNLLHIVGNLLGLYFLGRALQPVLGSKRLMWAYGSAVFLGGLAWLATHWMGGFGSAIGASAGVAGLFIVFACLYPNQPMTFLLFFILPVTLKPKYVAFALLAMELIGFGFYEVMGAVSPFGSAIAHSAHLGGMLAGWLFFRVVQQGAWRLPSFRRDVELPRWAQKSAKTATPTAYQVDLTRREDLRAEVDRILDKINSEGFGALTADEKRLLDDARDLLSRR
jgi:membrane associated rhomboid family serine protease